MRRESINALAELTGYDRRTLRKKLARLPFEESGRSHLYDTVTALATIYAATGEGYDLTREKARLAHHQADIAEIDARERKGDVVKRDAVVAAWQAELVTVRAKLLSLPTRTAAVLATIDDPRKVEIELRRVCHEILDELAEREPTTGERPNDDTTT